MKSLPWVTCEDVRSAHLRSCRLSADGCVSFYCASLTRRQAALIFCFAVIYYFSEGDNLMAESKLRTLSVDFAVQILNLVKFLKSQHEMNFS